MKANASQANTHLTREDYQPPGKINKQFRHKYQRIVGSLMYLSGFTCPNLAHSVNQCSRFMSNPGLSHMNAVRRILRYLAGSADLGITCEAQQKSRENLLWGFADTDHAGYLDTRHSVTGYWASNGQAVVALSSSEAEFYTASAAGCDIAHFCMILNQLGIPQMQPTIVFEDNWAYIHLSRNAVLHHKSKHIDVSVYHLCYLCKAGIMSLLKIGTDSDDQVADALTKELPQPVFVSHSCVMMNIKP
eukprot:3221090-Rhodomonas_salina.3